MNPIVFAMRRPMTVMVIMVAVVLAGLAAIRPRLLDQQLATVGIELPLKRMPVDIFPALNLPVIYVCQPYGGMDPAQMEGLITNYYEYHFLYISGIHHVESKSVQGNALMKLFFHPAEMALAESSAGTAQLQEFHQQLFNLSSDPLRREIKRITGLDVCTVAQNRAAVAVQVFAIGTVVQVYLLAGRLPSGSWDGN